MNNYLSIPVWVPFALTAVFFIREVYIRSMQKPNDFITGYKQALRDISDRWNWMLHKELSYKDFFDNMRKFIQSKLDEAGMR
jgi:hypothetical protein